MLEIPPSALFWGFMTFYWTMYQFHVHLSWDFCQKSYRQSVFCEIFGATRQFSNSPSLFHQFSASLAPKFKQNSDALLLGMAQTSLDPLLLPIVFYYSAAKLFFHAENSFICCLYSPVLRLKSPFSEKIFWPSCPFLETPDVRPHPVNIYRKGGKIFSGGVILGAPEFNNQFEM